MSIPTSSKVSINSIDKNTPSSSIQDGISTPTKRVRAEELRYQSEMMFIGQRCFWHECNREDFLPFRCADCQHQFCSEHFKNEQHHCANPKKDFVVPQCPLCHEPPKGWKRDEDPNVAMDAHLTPNSRTGLIECSALSKDGKIIQKQGQQQHYKKRENECNERRCHKLMVVPIKCPQCSLQFCPSHRAPVQHQCSEVSASSSQSKGKSPSAANALLESLAAKRANAQNSNKAKISQSKSDAIADKMESMNPIRAIHAASNERKMDKRAKNEQSSAIKAMQARNAKGLLTQSEQMKLAEEMAKLRTKGESEKKTNKKDDCIIV